MPALGPATLALSDAELRETLDLHSRVIASMSYKLDEQGTLQQQLIELPDGRQLTTTALNRAHPSVQDALNN